MPALVSTVSEYNHSHFSSMMLEMNGGNEVDEAVKNLCREVLSESVAEEWGLDVVPSNTLFFPGYQGLSAEAQSWQDYHYRLHDAIGREAFQQGIDFPEGRLPQPEFAPVWNTLPLDSHLSSKVRFLPYWGGAF